MTEWFRRPAVNRILYRVVGSNPSDLTLFLKTYSHFTRDLIDPRVNVKNKNII